LFNIIGCFFKMFFFFVWKQKGRMLWFIMSAKFFSIATTENFLFLSTGGVTRWVCGKIAQNVKNKHNNYVPWKRSQYFGYFLNFQKTDQSKQSSNGRKFSQPGHPVYKILLEKTFIRSTAWLPDFYWFNLPTDMGKM
jgi:hypothetical protein